MSNKLGSQGRGSTELVLPLLVVARHEVVGLRMRNFVFGIVPFYYLIQCSTLT